MKQRIVKILKISFDIFFYLLMIGVGYFLLRIFVVDSYKIPTHSMMPTLIPGDNILVNKLAYGPRWYDIFEVATGKRTNINRLPGYQNIQRNDVVVFNNPYPNNNQQIQMEFAKFYLKRCIALPGDTLYIKEGFYSVNHLPDTLGYYPAQQQLHSLSREQLKGVEYEAFPWDSIVGWTIKDFGGLYLPKKGDMLTLHRTESLLYKKLIEWETECPLRWERDTLWQDQTPLTHYTFKHNYYFMAGDNVLNSRDSRYIGLIPDEYIAGKVWFIWKAVNLNTNEFRWERFLKVVR
ncbi:signal peptidase I [Capnocytophaga sp. oral taxon 878]|uniref:signal peptidase I n=1 Tax=Capnocytophaga sp. oral taxon 878 TaxID=1316596 RepID=UPI000D04800B|nr:signal peptidase I [Capnocytophaga sp. oral taxon 878]AVM50404.1 signal peptidase I [Capnocytophaga sp. oral taxon 878]